MSTLQICKDGQLEVLKVVSTFLNDKYPQYRNIVDAYRVAIQDSDNEDIISKLSSNSLLFISSMDYLLPRDECLVLKGLILHPLSNLEANLGQFLSSK